MIKTVLLVNILAFILVFLFTLAGSIVSLNRYWQYETFYFDFGIFDQAIWKAAHFQPPIIDHLVVSGKWIWADHFNPGIFILSPLYWFTDRPEVLLIAQAVIVGLSGLALYFLAREVLKNNFASLSILISYYLFLGLQNAVITDFHEVTVATLPFALTFYSLIKKNLKLYILFALITLGFKESNFILGAAIGIFIMFFDKKWFKVGLSTAVFSLIYGVLIIRFVIPYFSEGVYLYSEPLNFNPVSAAEKFIDNPIKINTMFYTFSSFAFLPLFSPAFLILILQDFFVRFYSDLGSTRITLGLHYSALLSVIMAVASIFGLKFIFAYIKKSLINFIIIIIIINSIFLYRFILHGPFALAYNPAFYKHTNDFRFLNELVSKIPKKTSVMTQNNIASHFSHQEVYFLRMNYKKFNPDYIVIDAREGQNPNNFFGERNFDLDKFLVKISKDKCYKPIYKTKYQFLFKKVC